MTPTEQSAAILAACGSRPGHPLRLAFSGIIAVAIRAAVDQVPHLPTPAESSSKVAHAPLETTLKNAPNAQTLLLTP